MIGILRADVEFAPFDLLPATNLFGERVHNSPSNVRFDYEDKCRGGQIFEQLLYSNVDEVFFHPD